MKKILIILMVALITSCKLSTEDPICSDELEALSIEAYLVQEGDTIFITDDLSLLSEALYLCSNVDLDGKSGEIFLVDGRYVNDCGVELCFAIDAYDNPACIPTYAKSTTDLPFASQWFVSHVIEDGNILYPSCNFDEINLTFIDNGIYTLANCDLGVNKLSFELFFLDEDNAFVTGGLSVSETFAPPYTALIESEIVDFFSTPDTLAYQITGNEMTIVQKEDRSIHLYGYDLN